MMRDAREKTDLPVARRPSSVAAGSRYLTILRREVVLVVTVTGEEDPPYFYLEPDALDPPEKRIRRFGR